MIVTKGRSTQSENSGEGITSNPLRVFPSPLDRVGAGTLSPSSVLRCFETTRENLEFLGTTIKEIQAAAPKAYEKRIRRPGTLNAFHDKAFVAAVAATKRPNLVLAGITTDVCLFHSAVSAIEAGYNVQVVADACGCGTPLGDTVTYDRLRSLGVVVTTTYGALFELYSDLSTPEGQRAEGVAAASVAKAA